MLLSLARKSRSAWPLCAVLLSSMLACALPSTSRAAGEEQAPPKKGTPRVAIPEPEEQNLVTADGVNLKATFYPGTKGKNSVPIILLHEYKGSRKDYADLAVLLQKEGHALLVPDLRGHGDSTSATGAARQLDAKTLAPGAFTAMVAGDMEACKKFLVEKNNEAQLNIDKLCLIGAEMGGLVAMEYARLDWSWPPLVTGKQGQDVKAVVLISPQWSFRSLQMRPVIERPDIVSRLATLILVGQKDHRAQREAKRLYARLKRFHPSADEEKASQRTLIYWPLPTSLQGTKILDEPGLRLPERIKAFVKWRLVDQKLPWKKRDAMPLDR